MEKKVISLPAGSLSSRKSAAAERQKVEHFIIEGGIHLHYDLTGVSSMSESYSDELFGVLVLNHGVQKVLNHLQINNADEHVLESIAKVVKRRSDERDALNSD